MGAQYLDLFFAREEVLVCMTELTALSQAPVEEAPVAQADTCDLCGEAGPLTIHYSEDSFGVETPILGICADNACDAPA